MKTENYPTLEQRTWDAIRTIWASSPIFDQATAYAIHCHESTNHLYDNKPYRVHLDEVDMAILSFIYYIPEEDRDNVRAAGRCHDVIEDCRQTHNDVLKATNAVVADLVYCVTNEKGKTRSERANEKYYQGIRETKYGVFLKLADRIANIKYSKDTGSRMLEVYRKEHNNFVEKLGGKDKYSAMFDYLEKLLENHTGPVPVARVKFESKEDLKNRLTYLWDFADKNSDIDSLLNELWNDIQESKKTPPQKILSQTYGRIYRAGNIRQAVLKLFPKFKL